MKNITLAEMLESGVHFGHNKSNWNPAMQEYIFGVRHKIHIINLEKSIPMFLDALNTISSIIAGNGSILIVGTKQVASKLVEQHAKEGGMHYVNHRWLGGMLTNFKTIKQSIRRLKEIETMELDGSFKKLTKKEILKLKLEQKKKERDLGGIKNMRQMPSALFVIDTRFESIAVQEAKKLNIPVIAILDTNNSPQDVDVVIPGNDDSLKAIDFYLRHVANTVKEARDSKSSGNKKEDVVVVKKEKSTEETKPVAQKPEDKTPSAAQVASTSTQKDTDAKGTVVKKEEVMEKKPAQDVAFSAQDVKELRELSGAGMMDCKKALTETKGDKETALEYLRKKGITKADQKSSRVTSEGVLAIEISEDKKQAALLEVNCETDFVSRGEELNSFANKVAQTALKTGIKDLDQLKDQKLDDKTIEETRLELVSKIGENISLRRLHLIASDGAISSYKHMDRIAVLVELDKDSEQVGKDIAMHVAASAPIALDATNLDPKLIEKEKEILRAQAQESGKPADIIEKMLSGRMDKFFEENTLLAQSFIKNPDIKVADYLKQNSVAVKSYIRFLVGEGIEKVAEDYVAEVAKAAAAAKQQ